MIYFVIPVYNRIKNLERTIEGLARQTAPVDSFQVIVSDDGSTDGSYELAMKLDRVDYVIKQSHAGCNISRVRNKGTRQVGKDCTYVWYIDSDVILNPNAVAAFIELEKTFDEPLVVCGRYDWMPPMQLTTEAIFANFDKWVACEYPWLPGVSRNVPYGGIRAKDPTVRRRIDHRSVWNTGTFTVIPCSGATLTGNLVVPIEAFREIAGFDENIQGSGEDCDFGRNLGKHGYSMTSSEAIIGYHQFHERDSRAATEHVKKTIAYMAEKYKGK